MIPTPKIEYFSRIFSISISVFQWIISLTIVSKINPSFSIKSQKPDSLEPFHIFSKLWKALILPYFKTVNCIIIHWISDTEIYRKSMYSPLGS